MTNDKVKSLPEAATSLQAGGKTLIGKVVSVAMNKTVVVDVERSKTHRLYGKSFTVNSKIKARNELGDLAVGDTVTITETRPISREVAFKVIKVGGV